MGAKRKFGFVAARRKSMAFTLIEMMVTVLLVGVGIAGVFGGIRALALAQAKAKMAERLQSLAMSKMNEMGAVTDPSSAATSGNFADQGEPNANYTVDAEATDTENLDKITVTVTEGTEQQSLTSLLYIPAATSTSGTTTSTGSAGGATGAGQ